MKDILPNCLYEAGAKVTSTKRTKHRIIPPGSTCFVSRFSPLSPHAPNLISIELIITKNGKKGKDRVNCVEVSTAVFPIEFEMRPLKAKKYQSRPVVELEREPLAFMDIMAVSPMDFIGWAFAYKKQLRQVFNNNSMSAKWPHGKGQYVNGFGSVAIRMAQSPHDTIEQLTRPEFKVGFVNQLRSLEASVIQCVLADRIKKAETRVRALSYLMWWLKQSGKDKKALDKVYHSYKHYRLLLENEQVLEHKIRLSRWASLPAKRRKLMPKPSKRKPARTADMVMKQIKAYINAEEVPQFAELAIPADEGAYVPKWYNPPQELFTAA